MTQPFILATAGHVDHGKSSLVKALTGTDPDRLPEEKRRGITIDLGFAHLELDAPPGNTHGAKCYSCGIVDVPGHEDFVKNMVAGAGSIDVALLVVAADDCWMPQTEEHLQILLYLGVTRAIVALTKSDLTVDVAQSITTVRHQLDRSALADAPIIPISVVTGLGLETLKRTVAGLLAVTLPPADLGKPRLWVDRAFVLKGIGTVVTGTLSGGSLSRGDEIVVQPAGSPSRIRSCQSHGRSVEQVAPGTRTALNLPDLSCGDSVGTGGTGGTIGRGDVISRASFGRAASTWDVVLEKSGRLAGSTSPASKPLKGGTRVKVHLGSCQVPASVQLLRDDALVPGARVLAQLRLERPAFAFAGDRFILRDGSERATLCGGLVLDPDARRSGARNPRRLELLTACGTPGAGSEEFVRAHLDQAGEGKTDDLLVRSRFSSTDILAGLQRLLLNQEAVVAGHFVVTATLWHHASQTAIRMIDAHHLAHPEQPGLPLVDLRARVKRETGLHFAFEGLAEGLCRTGFVARGVIIRRANHHPALPPALQGPGQRLREILARQPLDPPNRKELAPDTASQQALRYLLQTGEAVELGPEAVLSTEAFARARDGIRNYLRLNGSATASSLRLLLGSRRRILIPLLEKLERDGVTRRDGDTHRLRD